MRQNRIADRRSFLAYCAQDEFRAKQKLAQCFGKEAAEQAQAEIYQYTDILKRWTFRMKPLDFF